MSGIALENKKWTVRKITFWLATAYGPATLFVFNIVMWHYGVGENIATFLLWGVIDAVFCAGMLKDGKTAEAIFPGLYAAIVAITVTIIYQIGTWHWGNIESVCAVLVVLALIALWQLTAKAAVVTGVVALSVAAIPVIIDSYLNPQPWTWWFWIAGSISGLILYLMTPNRKLENLTAWLFNLYAAVAGTAITVLNILPLLQR